MQSQYVQPGAYFYTTPSSHSRTPSQSTTWDNSANHTSQYPFYSSQYTDYAPYPTYPSPASSDTSPSSSSSHGFSPVMSHATGSDIGQPKAFRAARRASTSATARRSSTTHATDTVLGTLLDQPSRERPTYSVKALCEAAIKSSRQGKLTLVEICEAIQERYPFFKDREEARKLKNTARHDLSLDPRFVNTKRLPHEPGRGDFWAWNEAIAHPEPVGKSRKSASGILPMSARSSARRASLSSRSFFSTPSYDSHPAPVVQTTSPMAHATYVPSNTGYLHSPYSFY